jgi:hypothetical protein
MKKDRGTKSESLSLRLDPKMKFALEFVARVRGQTLTTVIERAVREYCDRVTIAAVPGDSTPANWQQFWEPEEGTRTLRLLASPEYLSNFDEDDLRDFVRAHWEFFYSESECMIPRRAFVQMLWPKIESYRGIWKEKRETDYWAAGRAMAADLRAAKLVPPQWPRTAATHRGSMDDVIHDDIPF